MLILVRQVTINVAIASYFVLTWIKVCFVRVVFRGGGGGGDNDHDEDVVK